jgi:hypothetical protein
VTEEILKELWKIEDITACKDGMTLAHDFLRSCMSALESGNASNFNARFENFKRHRDTCEKCSGLGAVA